MAGPVLSGLARADGGTVRASQPIGSLLVTVFTAPTPLRAGPVDISVMVQRDAAAVLDASVSLALQSHADPALERRTVATRAAATNKLLYAALIDLPVAGRWTVEVGVRSGAEQGTVAFDADIGEPPPPWLAYWPYLLLPFVAIGVYAAHYRLRSNRGQRAL